MRDCNYLLIYFYVTFRHSKLFFVTCAIDKRMHIKKMQVQNNTVVKSLFVKRR